MPRNKEELASMIAQRDQISFEEAYATVNEAAADMEYAFMCGDLVMVEDILRMDLGLEPDYLDIFIC